MQTALLGIGTAVPPTRVTQWESIVAATAMCAEEEGHAELLQSLYRQAGIEARHVVYRPDEVLRIVYNRGECDSPFVPTGKGDRGPSTGRRMERFEREALPLALLSAQRAIDDANLDAAEITHLVTVSCTGFAAPGVDIGLIKGLELSATVERTQVGFMGCHGALNGLRVARGLLAAEPSSKILLTSVELCSLHNHYGWNPKKMVGNALFADGAASVVIGPNEGVEREKWTIAACGACLFPNSEPAMGWHVRDNGFDMTLSTRVPNLIQQHLRGWLQEWLARHELRPEDVATWAVHPGGPRVLTGVEEALGLNGEATEVSWEIMKQHGNMSSATILFILDELIRRKASRPCVALGFGPGLAGEAVWFA